MNATQTATIEVIDQDEQQLPMPIRIIRKVNGRYQFVEVQEAELTQDERREVYCSMFNIYE